MENSNFLDNLIAGNAAAAKESLNDMLSQKAFSVLENLKVELAKAIYASQEEPEVTDEVETEEESTEEQAT